MGAEGLGEGGEGLFPGTGEEADGPVGAEEEAAGAEGFPKVLDVGAEVGWGPVGPVGFGDHAGDFDGEVGDGGELEHGGGPGVELALGDAGFAEVVED